MRILMMAVVLIVVAATNSAEAGGYRYCLKTSPGPGDCKYQNYKQCKASMSGTGGTCIRNYGPR
jgi:hypothetical protein